MQATEINGLPKPVAHQFLDLFHLYELTIGCYIHYLKQ